MDTDSRCVVYFVHLSSPYPADDTLFRAGYNKKGPALLSGHTPALTLPGSCMAQNEFIKLNFLGIWL
jgi:hypothetical protein